MDSLDEVESQNCWTTFKKLGYFFWDEREEKLAPGSGRRISLSGFSIGSYHFLKDAWRKGK